LHPQQPQQIPRPQVAPPTAHAPQQGIRPPQATGRPGIAPMPTMPRPTSTVADDSIALVEEENVPVLEETPKAAVIPSKIKFGPTTAHKQHEWKRKPVVNGTGACRLKSFHAKYSDQGVEHLDDLVNEWLDEHPEIEVKFSTTTVHVFEGKIREPAIVMNVWY